MSEHERSRRADQDRPSIGVLETEAARSGPNTAEPIMKAAARLIRIWSAPDQPPSPVSARVMERRAEGYAPGAQSRPAFGAPAASTTRDVSRDEVLRTLAESASARNTAIDALGNEKASSSDRVLPEDGSYIPSVLHVGIEFNGTDRTLLRQLAEIGQVEGFRITAHGAPWALRAARLLLPGALAPIVSFLPTEVDETEKHPWLEDYGELTAQGNVTLVPKARPRGEDWRGRRQMYTEREWITRAQEFGRYDRLCPLEDPKDPDSYHTRCDAGDFSKGNEKSFGTEVANTQGAAADGVGQAQLAQQALSTGGAVRMSRSYLEGGNALVGTLPGGEGYAIVGRDSIEITRRLFERQLDRPVSDEEVLNAMALDLGIKPARVIPVEQPRSFHIDMAMMLLGGGQVIVNDARAAARLTLAWRQGDPGFDEAKRQAALKLAERTAELEDKAEAELRSAGLGVHRVPGVFPDMPTPINFLNAESATAKDGRKFAIVLGGDPRAEQVFLEHLAKIPGGPERVYLLDPAIAPVLLAMSGGLNCRVKGQGPLVE